MAIIEREASTGRPTLYNVEVARELVARYAAGETLDSIFKDERMPGQWTFYNWQKVYVEFSQSVDSARKHRANNLADKHLQISLLASTLTGRDDRPDGARVALQGLQWQTAMLDPDNYSERKKVDITIKDDLGNALLQARNRLKELEDSQMAQDAEIVDPESS